MKGMVTRALVLFAVAPFAVHSKYLQEGVDTKNIDGIIKEPRSLQNSGHVSMNTIHKNLVSFEGHHTAFLSATIDADLYPVKGKMTEEQKHIFEQGVLSIMNEKLSEELKDDGLTFISITTTKNEIKFIKGATIQDPKTLYVQTVVSAQQILPKEVDASNMMTKSQFGQIVVNLSTIYDDELMNTWNTEEAASTQETEGMEFDMLADIHFTLIAPPETPTRDDKRKTFGLPTIILLSITGSMTFVAFAYVIYQKVVERGIVAESSSLMGYSLKDSRLKPHQNIRDLLKEKGVQDDVTFVPYPDAQLDPPKFQRKNKYSTLAVTNENNEGDDFGISFSNSEDDEFLDNESAMRGECFAPSGKLGVAIDTVNGKPVVHRVRDESPLVGVLRKFDIIIAIDEIDTSAMTAADITSLMAKRMANGRKITYLRGAAAQNSLRSPRS